MNTITDLTKALMILVNAGGIFRVIALLFNIVSDPDSKEQNLHRIKNVILFMICTLLIYSLKGIVLKYYQ